MFADEYAAPKSWSLLPRNCSVARAAIAACMKCLSTEPLFIPIDVCSIAFHMFGSVAQRQLLLPSRRRRSDWNAVSVASAIGVWSEMFALLFQGLFDASTSIKPRGTDMRTTGGRSKLVATPRTRIVTAALMKHKAYFHFVKESNGDFQSLLWCFFCAVFVILSKIEFWVDHLADLVEASYKSGSSASADPSTTATGSEEGDAGDAVVLALVQEMAVVSGCLNTVLVRMPRYLSDALVFFPCLPLVQDEADSASTVEFDLDWFSSIGMRVVSVADSFRPVLDTHIKNDKVRTELMKAWECLGKVLLSPLSAQAG